MICKNENIRICFEHNLSSVGSAFYYVTNSWIPSCFPYFLVSKSQTFNLLMYCICLFKRRIMSLVVMSCFISNNWRKETLRYTVCGKWQPYLCACPSSICVPTFLLVFNTISWAWSVYCMWSNATNIPINKPVNLSFSKLLTNLSSYS